MAQLEIKGGSTFGATRKALRSMFTELYSVWTGDNLDIAGTLDVTGAAVLDSTLSVAGATIIMSALPVADPSVAGQLWANAGVVTVSAG